MSYKKTKLSKNFIAKDDALNKYYTFDEFCTNFDDYKGKELGIADDSDGDSDTSDSSDSDSDCVSDLTDTESVDSFHSSRSNTRSASSPYQIFQLEMSPRASKRR